MTKGLTVSAALLTISASAIAQPPASEAPREISLAASPAPEVAAAPAPGGDAPLPAPPPEVEAAPVALLVDVGSGRTLYAHDAERHFLPASTTKTMTAFVAFELMAEGKLRPDQKLTVSDDAWKEWHAKGSRMFLDRGSSVSVDELLMGIMNVSANDGCIVLAEGVAGSVQNWVALMNETARKLGMTGSHFGTPNGWMDNGNTYYTARDLARLAEAMITRYPAYYHRYVGRPGLTWNGITQRNHDPILGVVQGADGIKTGFTNEAHYNFVGSAERDGRRLVMVLAGVPTPREREKAARALMEWGFSAWDGTPLVREGVKLGKAEVQGGVNAAVDLVAPRAFFATLPKGEKEPVSMRIVYKGPLVAPLAKGEEVAALEVKVGGQAPTQLPLVAGEAIARGSAFDRLRLGLAKLVS